MEIIKTAPAQSGPDTQDKPSNINNNTQAAKHSTRKIRRALSPRQARALETLLAGPCSREKLDRVTGASNGPNVIMQLRKRGISIQCRMEGHIDRDGIAGQHGVYWLPDSERQRIGSLKLLGG
ncbi:hypothetical protein MO867_01910 [Microbulbifer sp. OS29]|uniref:Helix-turn-helix domain-containing protein n=1 Tax=Microbulbifer okhotskensis TaxID=2926617 RepID=A0A9X2EK45_9GAMM|nr:hypothetical protein [Microbulbifer okhotskensis]MCO1333085.1 hypothetical protein [Microbulbifer okhotskensis]